MPNGVPDFRLLFERAPAPYLVLDAQFTIVAVSDAYLAATMTERAAIVGRNLFDVFPDNPAEVDATGVSNLRTSLQRVVATLAPDTMAVQKYDIRRPESAGGGFEERHWSPINTPIVVDGALRYIVHRVEDVTDFVVSSRERTAEQESTQELRVRATELERELYRRAQELQRANQELRHLHAELEGRVAQTSGDLAREADARQRTESELRRSEEQLRQAQKLEAVGRLAAGIAHDFNNLLTGIGGSLEMMGRRVTSPSDDFLRFLDLAKTGVSRAANLTQRLLAFSRQQPLQVEAVDANKLVSGMSELLRRTLGEQIKIETVLAGGLWRCQSDIVQLESAILNLAINGRDAMPEGGTLTIETANAHLDDAYAAANVEVKAGQYVLIAVSDTGEGMDQELMAKAFDPFFTTKQRGQGTGLGLSMTFGYVKQVGGHLKLYSEVGHGTVVKIYLPRSGAAPVDAKERPAPAVRSLGDGPVVLVVEDDPVVREFAGSACREIGCTVHLAGDGREALAVLRVHDDIALLFTDVGLPGDMNGRQLAAAACELRPTLKVLYTTGYTANAIVHHGVLDAGVNFIGKPFSIDALAAKVKSLGL